MEKRRYPATRQPLDLESFIANFMEDYEEGLTMQIGPPWQPLYIGSRDPYCLGSWPLTPLIRIPDRVNAKTNAE